MPKNMIPFSVIFGKIKEAYDTTKPANDVRPYFDDIFESIKENGLPLSDTENGLPRFPIYLEKFIYYLNHRCDLLVQFWLAWCEVRNIDSKPRSFTFQDYFALKILINVREEFLQVLDKEHHLSVNETVFLGKDIYKDDKEALQLVGTFLIRCPLYSYEEKTGREFLARAEYLKIEPQLRNDIGLLIAPYVTGFETTKRELNEAKKSAEDEIKKLEKETKEGDRVYKQLEDQTKRAEIRSIQVIGIFAAIMAFIVATIPAAARLEKLSLFLAIAGLAIVLGGFLLLIAILFGGEKKPHWAWISIPVVLLFIWLVFVINPTLIKIDPDNPNLKENTKQVQSLKDSIPK
jgi:hypothetical protein